ncbi:MAG: hypothetical protein AB7O80_09545 [Acetobacteraceae bacterium]
MATKPAFLMAASLLLLTTCAPQPEQATKATPQGESMQHMLVAIETVRNYVRNTTTQAEAEAATADLLTWSNRMAELFPPATASKLYVDMTAEMAKEAPGVMVASATALRSAVSTGRLPIVAMQLERTEKDGCGFCHRRPYRMPAP